MMTTIKLTQEQVNKIRNDQTNVVLNAVEIERLFKFVTQQPQGQGQWPTQFRIEIKQTGIGPSVTVTNLDNNIRFYISDVDSW